MNTSANTPRSATGVMAPALLTQNHSNDSNVRPGGSIIMNRIKLSVCTTALATLATATAATAAPVVLVETGSPGFYNANIGTVLNGSNGGEAGPFPVSDDSTRAFPAAPDLSAADSALGNWLGAPGSLNSNWAAPSAIPNTWAQGTEVGLIYRFDTGGATNVVARFGVDNGIHAWLDGTYLFGARAGGGATLGEYTLPLGDLAAGTHYLQLLLEDHGGNNGYAVSITADNFQPPPVPEPSTYALTLGGLAALGWMARRRRAAGPARREAGAA